MPTRMDWPDRADEIQARFFRTGTRTFLWLDYGTGGPTLLRWSFTFMDLGMCHTLSGRARVQQQQENKGWLVNGKEHASENDAMHAVFAGHFQSFVDGLYRDMLEGL